MSTHAVSPLSIPILPPSRKEAGWTSPAVRGIPRAIAVPAASATASKEKPPPDAIARRQKRRNRAAGRRSCSPVVRRADASGRGGILTTLLRPARRRCLRRSRAGTVDDVFVCSGDRSAKAVGSTGRAPAGARDPSSAPGQAHDEAGTLREPGGHGDGSTVRLDHLAHDEEPDPEVQAARTPAVGVVAAPEWVEQVRQHLGRDWLAQVVHRERPLRLAPLAVDRHRSVLGAVLEGVGNEVRHDLLQAARIPPAVPIPLDAKPDIPPGATRPSACKARARPWVSASSRYRRPGAPWSGRAGR